MRVLEHFAAAATILGMDAAICFALGLGAAAALLGASLCATCRFSARNGYDEHGAWRSGEPATRRDRGHEPLGSILLPRR